MSMAGTLLSVLAGWMLSGRNAAAAAFFCSLFWCTLHLSKESRRYQGMRLLAGQIDEILHGNDRPEFQHFQEGDLEILRDEIYKMTIRLKEQAALLQKEKTSLADALADISHQIRTPLTALHILLERLRSPELDVDARRRLLREAGMLLSKNRMACHRAHENVQTGSREHFTAKRNGFYGEIPCGCNRAF